MKKFHTFDEYYICRQKVMPRRSALTMMDQPNNDENQITNSLGNFEWVIKYFLAVSFYALTGPGNMQHVESKLNERENCYMTRHHSYSRQGNIN